MLLPVFYVLFLIDVIKGLKNLNYPNFGKNEKHSLSIVIPFRNEEENILNVLKSIEAQNYPEDLYEVIFVNDHSEDKSVEILKSFITKHNIKIISATETGNKRAFKKKAILQGIELASGELIVLTDADCLHSPEWLNSLVNHFDKDTAFVSGPVEFISDGSFFSELQQLEFYGLIIVGAGLIGVNKPVICNSANLAFRKNVFFEVGGYNDQFHLSSGDDELLMQKIHRQTKYKIKFAPEINAIVKTKPNKTLKEFFNQRKRWASKSLFYKNAALKIKLMFLVLFYIALPLQLFLGIYLSPYFLISFLVSLTVKFLFEYFTLNIGKKIFASLKFKYFLLAELFHLPYIIISSLSGLIGNFEWKGRELKR